MCIKQRSRERLIWGTKLNTKEGEIMNKNGFRKVVSRIIKLKSEFVLVFSFIFILIFIQGVQKGFCQSDYPNKAITIYVSFAPGGQTDVAMRKLAPEVSKILGQPVVIENKPGAGGVVATAFISKQKADGYQLVATQNGCLVRAPHMQKVPYDAFKEITPIVQFIINMPGIFVKSDSPLKNFNDFAKLAKSSKEAVKYGVVGVGSGSYLTMESLKKNYGFNLEAVPFQGDTPTNTAVQGGHVPVGCGSTGGFGPLTKQGVFRILAFFGDSRLDIFPDVPNVKEFGYNIALDTKMILIGPRDLPSPVIEKLENAFKKAMNTPDYKKLMSDMCITSEPFRGSQALKTLLLEEYKMYGELIQKLGIEKKQ
jgi:tripartite-type tricarboxylate transporter receptor subunit TctC